jgi:LacI family transcriptional regulator
MAMSNSSSATLRAAETGSASGGILADRPVKQYLAPRVAILVDTATGWGRGLVKGIASYSHHQGPWHLWAEAHGRSERMRPPRHWTGEGIIARVSNQAMARQLERYKVPIVNVSGINLAGVTWPRVTTDHVAGGQMAAEYFLSRGFRSFGYVGWQSFHYVEAHYRSFAEALDRRGFECPLFPLGVGNMSAVGWRKQQSQLAKWLKGLPKPLAILCWAQQGLAVLDACWWAKLHVPEQVAVLSGDDDDTLYPAAWPPLSGMAVPAEQIGRQAAEILDHVLQGKKPPQTEVRFKPTHIVERVSTDTLAVDDPETAAAVRYIRDNAVHGIQVDDVAEHVAMSRRSLERRFQDTLGHSPADEIRRVRVRKALLLLTGSSMPIPKVAELSGFGSGMYLSQVIRAETGMTPLKYRNLMRSEKAES